MASAERGPGPVSHRGASWAPGSVVSITAASARARGFSGKKRVIVSALGAGRHLAVGGQPRLSHAAFPGPSSARGPCPSPPSPGWPLLTGQRHLGTRRSLCADPHGPCGHSCCPAVCRPAWAPPSAQPRAGLRWGSLLVSARPPSLHPASPGDSSTSGKDRPSLLPASPSDSVSLLSRLASTMLSVKFDIHDMLGILRGTGSVAGLPGRP